MTTRSGIRNPLHAIFLRQFEFDSSIYFPEIFFKALHFAKVTFVNTRYAFDCIRSSFDNMYFHEKSPITTLGSTRIYQSWTLEFRDLHNLFMKA